MFFFSKKKKRNLSNQRFFYNIYREVYVKQKLMWLIHSDSQSSTTRNPDARTMIRRLQLSPRDKETIHSGGKN